MVNQKITLIIFSYNRQNELKKKILKYKNKYNLIILDRSNESIEKFCNQNLNKSSLYLYKPRLNYLERSLMLKNFIKTKYISIQTDDDYFLNDQINHAIQFLEKNPNYSSVIGYGFTYRKFLNKIYLNKIYNKVDDLNQDNFLDRLAFMVKNDYTKIVYGFLRTSVFKKHLSALKKNYKFYQNDLFQIWHLHLMLVMVINGKIKTLNKVFFIRNSKLYRRKWIKHDKHMHISVFKKFNKNYYDVGLKNILKISKKLNHNNFYNLKKFTGILLQLRANNQRLKIRNKKNIKKLIFLKKIIPNFLIDLVLKIRGKYGDEFNKKWFDINKIKFSIKYYKKILHCDQYFNNP